MLERNSRHVQLTDAGQTLLREGRKILSQARHAIRATRAAGTGMLKVGFYGSAGAAVLPDVLRLFNQHHPGYAVSVHELLLGNVEDILNGRVNIAFTRLQPGQTELEVDVLAQEPRLVAVAGSHRLAAREAVTYADLAEESFIINPAVPTEGPPARWIAEQRRHRLPGRIAAEASSLQEILALVAAGRGVCLLPSTVARHYPHPDVTYLPCSDAEPAIISLAQRPGSASPAIQAFIQTAHQVAGASEAVQAIKQESPAH